VVQGMFIPTGVLRSLCFASGLASAGTQLGVFHLTRVAFCNGLCATLASRCTSPELYTPPPVPGRILPTLGGYQDSGGIPGRNEYKRVEGGETRIPGGFLVGIYQES